ncbi:hypothetical protein AAVH_26597, partial [Aphelenchoides avenae]
MNWIQRSLTASGIVQDEWSNCVESLYHKVKQYARPVVSSLKQKVRDGKQRAKQKLRSVLSIEPVSDDGHAKQGGRRIAEIVRAKLKKLLAEKKPIACDCETKSVVQSLAASPADVWLTFTMIVLGVACGAVFFMGILLKRPRPITEEAHEVLPEEGVSGQVSE